MFSRLMQEYFEKELISWELSILGTDMEYEIGTVAETLERAVTDSLEYLVLL